MRNRCGFPCMFCLIPMRLSNLLALHSCVSCFLCTVWHNHRAWCTQARQYISGYSNGAAQTVGAVRVSNLASGRAAGAIDTCEVHCTPDRTRLHCK